MNTLALAVPASYAMSRGWINASGNALLLICLTGAAFTAIISSALLYSMAVLPLIRIKGVMMELCRSVGTMSSGEGAGDTIETIGSGLLCLEKQWEQSRQRLTEANREEINRMEKLATLGEMAFSVAHDIKNPLAGISGAIQVFAEDIPNDDPRGEIVREILDEIARLDRTVKDLQDYARPPLPHPMPAQVLFMLERAVRDVSDYAKNNGIDVRIAEESVDLEVNVDTELIHQALMNIMDYCMKNMPDGGSLTLFARSCDHEDMSEIVIRDNSSGLKGESMDTLFKPFRASRMSQRGLSMAISRAVVEMHGGKIGVESSPGAGTTFIIALPVYRNNA